MAETADAPVTDEEGTLSPSEAEHKKLFEEFASRHRPGAAPAAPAAEKVDEEGVEETTAATSSQDAAAAADRAAPGDSKDSVETHVDIWAKASPEQRAAFDAAQAKSQAYDQYVKSNEGRINSFQRQIDELNKALAGRAEATTKAQATAAETKADDAAKSLNDLLSDPDFLSAEKEYPEIYKPMRKTFGAVIAKAANIEANANAKLAEAATKLSALEATTSTKFEKDAIREESAEIVRLDPDYVEIVSRPDFQPEFDKWLADQPKAVQDLVANAAGGGVKNAKDTSWAFRRFKQDTGFGGGKAAASQGATSSTSSATDRTRRALQLETSTSVRSSRPGATPNAKDGQGDSVDADWKRNVERIRKRQQAEGIAY